MEIASNKREQQSINQREKRTGQALYLDLSILFSKNDILKLKAFLNLNLKHFVPLYLLETRLLDIVSRNDEQGCWVFKEWSIDRSPKLN